MDPRFDRSALLVPAADGLAGRLLTALGCWVTAGCFLVTWQWPLLLADGRWIQFGVAVLIFEFLTIHATAMLTFGLQRTKRQLQPRARWWMVALYAMMALGMAAAFRSWSLLVAFAALLAGRAMAHSRPDSRAGLAALHRRIAVSLALFLLLTFTSVLVPFPPGGLDPALLSDLWPERGGGLWERAPQQALAVGFVYFLVLGWVEVRPPGANWYRAADSSAAAIARSDSGQIGS